MNNSSYKSIQIMPYSMMVGQKQLKLALELTYIAPGIGGVLLSGQRGTGKSTLVRAFGVMMHKEGKLPVTLPINATEDRVVGGWDNKKLLQGDLVPQLGLLEEANEGLLYVDEINLLDDHIVNIILDVTSTGILVVEREGKDESKEVQFTLVGTMNPSEGGLRPQLLDRFGLMVDVVTEEDETIRGNILQAVLDYDAFRNAQTEKFVDKSKNPQYNESVKKVNQYQDKDEKIKTKLKDARMNLSQVVLPPEITKLCVRIAKKFQAEGHRGDYVMALAARAHAALRGAKKVEFEDILKVAPLALQHRRPAALQGEEVLWTEKDTEDIQKIFQGNEATDGGNISPLFGKKTIK